MSLLKLPPETLKHIFDEIGSSFFREELGRLTVCKQWLEFALPACFKCIALSPDTLRGLITSGVTRKPSLLRNSLETLDLELRAYEACMSTFHHRDDAQESNTLEMTAPNEARRNTPFKYETKALNDDLAQLAIAIQQSHRLRTLRIRAWSAPFPEPFDSPEDYLSLPTIQALFSVENLRVLVLDLSVSVLDSSGQQGNGHHICPAIGALLPTLRALHLRMRSICPDVLKPRDLNTSLSLSVVAINLSLTTNLPGVTSAAHSKRCGSRGRGLLQLKKDIKEQAEALATRMVSPKALRILTHSLPQFETQSLDVMTGKTMILDDNMAWDEDGKTVEEDSEPESELLDDDFSGFLDDE